MIRGGEIRGCKNGFEPLTFGATTRCSNQLNYLHHNFCAFGDSDSEPLPYRLDHVQIPWRQIRALRNVIAHNYGSVDIEHILIVLKTSKAYAGGRIR